MAGGWVPAGAGALGCSAIGVGHAQPGAAADWRGQWWWRVLVLRMAECVARLPVGWAGVAVAVNGADERNEAGSLEHGPQKGDARLGAEVGP